MTAEVIPPDATAAIFGQGGALARSFPGYAPREGQVAMARLVSDVLRDGGGCMVDAPCGTGKSVAYLAPAILRAVKRTGREMAGFMEESLPRAVLALRQGVGRLIRSTEDWGCVVVRDPRLSTKDYGADIIRSLGMPTRTRSIAEACAWLARGVEGMRQRQTAQAVGGVR